MPDHEALLAAMPAMSLTELAPLPARRRGRALARQAARGGRRRGRALPPDLTLVLIARAKAPAKLLEGGEGGRRRGPRLRGAESARDAAGAGRRRQALGFRLDPAAARMLVERMGASPVRLRNELERLALWAGEGGEVGAEDLEAMVADTSEAAVWSLSDALLEGDAAAALRDRRALIAQGENVTGLIYGLASRLRSACAAAAQLEEGVPPKQVESSLKMHPYAAKQLVGRLRDADLADCARRPRPWRTWRSGAAAAPTTATSWR